MGSWSRGRSKRYAHYHCRYCKKKNHAQDKVHAEFDQLLDENALNPNYANILEIAIRENMKTIFENAEKTRSKLNKRIKKLKQEQSTIVEKNLSGLFDDELTHRLLEEKRQKITNNEQELYILPTEHHNMNEVVAFGFQVLSSPRTTWHDFSLPQKQAFQALLFPEGVIFDQGKCRSAKTALILQTKHPALYEQGALVTPRGIEPRFPG